MLLQDIMLDEDRICFMHVNAISLIYFPRFSLYWYMKCLKLGFKWIKVISQDSKFEKKNLISVVTSNVIGISHVKKLSQTITNTLVTWC